MTSHADRGASAVEYALLLVGILAVLLASVVALTRVVGHTYVHDCNQVGTGGVSAAPTPCP